MMQWLRSFTFKQVGVGIALVIFFLAIVDFNARLDTLRQREDAVKTVRAEATAVMQTQMALQTAVAYATSDDAARRYGYESGQGEEGDHLVVPVPAPGSTPAALTEPTPEPVPPKNWEVWWQLFFGD
ncbi:MAG: hypothetical protein ACOYY3_12685 [Chloroflexota bacterium]